MTADRRSWEPRVVDQPRVGYFAARMVRGGMEVAVRVESGCKRSLFSPSPKVMWWCSVNGVSFGHEATCDPLANARCVMVWNHAREISKFEYLALLDARAGVDPFVAVDVATMPAAF